ncbi:MAG: hypothetical protein E5X67_33750 [Mesorhizobium sp.]|nr:MAG: hypothetical protein E5X67_33750 [Mesorhizobium sp.]
MNGAFSARLRRRLKIKQLFSLRSISFHWAARVAGRDHELCSSLGPRIQNRTNEVSGDRGQALVCHIVPQREQENTGPCELVVHESSDQRAFGRVLTRIGARVPIAVVISCAPPALPCLAAELQS